MLTPEKIAELQKRARKQSLDQQQLLHTMLVEAEKHGMAEPGTSEIQAQPPEDQDEVETASEE